MYHSDRTMRQMQAQKLLAQKLEKAIVELGHGVRNQAKNTDAGAKDILLHHLFH